MIADNLKAVRQRIARSCEKVGRPPEDITLVCVTKETGVPQIEEALAAGAKNFGENRVHELAAKHAAIGNRADWHLVGHLQTNKVRGAVKISSLIHSVDSIHLVKEIDKEAAKIGKVQDMLIQVNISGEETKFGLAQAAAADFIKESAVYNNISIQGLMTIAPDVDNPEMARPYFRKLKELLDKINERPRTTRFARVRGRRTTSDERRILSMGMTNDFEVAIEEGSTMVRIGRAIFGV